jgi:hypothetical protein
MKLDTKGHSESVELHWKNLSGRFSFDPLLRSIRDCSAIVEHGEVTIKRFF